MGYQPFVVVDVVKAPEQAPFAKMMREVKKGFGRTMTRLPEVFGVSRQTLYNWLEGETPKPTHQDKLRQLAESAFVFNDFGFKPTSQALDRKLSGGKSFLALLSEGCDGRETAKKLVRISQRGAESRSKLDELLGGRRARLDGSSIGTPSLNESV
jgi:transcriptional regulator with XRE-family HTH domain